MRTTLTLDDDVARRLEAEARRTRRSFKSVVNETLRAGLLRTSTRVKPFRVKAKALGLRANVDLANVEQLLDRLEGANRR